MSGRVCRGDGKSNKPNDKTIAIGQEDMAKAVELGVVPDELVVAGRLDVTHDEMTLHNMDLDLLEMSEGMTAWRAVGFAMERGLELPQWVRQYLVQTASALEDWAAMNAHPAELKAVLKLSGQRIASDPFCDPRWVFQQIAGMKRESPSKSIKTLSADFCRKHYSGSQTAESIRQKYYEGKKLFETGKDYKGRGRNKETPPPIFHVKGNAPEEF